MKSKYTDTFFILLDARCKDKKIPDDDLYEALRKIDKIIENEQSVQLSKKARDKYKIAKIEKGRVLYVYKCEGDWCKIKTNKTKGWIKNNSLWGRVN